MTMEDRLTRSERLITRLAYLAGAAIALLILIAVLGPTARPVNAASGAKS